MRKKRKILQIVAALVLVAGVIVPFFTNTSPATAQETKNPYVVRTFIDDEGNEIAMVVVPGKPPELEARTMAVPEPENQMGINILGNVPAFDWCYGCSATSAAMIFGYYDRTGYSNMYTGTTNGGVCPLDNSVWGTTYYPDTCGYGDVTCGECPLSATHNGLDGRVINGHVDDYWIAYGCTGPDPWEGGTEHTQGDCTGDYMGTNQWKYGDPLEYNHDGETVFFFDWSGIPVVDYTGDEPTYRDGCHGMRLFAESRGYSVATNFTQLIYGYGGNTLGFTFADYVAEIDAGRPVIIQVEGHSMVGYGYDDTSGQVVYLHNTWDHSYDTMTWGGFYSGRQHWGVSVIQLNAFPNAPDSPLCEGETNPTDVLDPTPEFSWTFSDPDGGDTQGAYQILVASTSENLTADNGDMWDSGKVSSSDNVVSYAGTGLAESQTYYWKVKNWDNNDAEGPYCSQQQFTTDVFISEVWVDDDYCDGCGNDGHAWGIDAFDNIQDGIDAVSGSTVHVAAGYYTENITLVDGVEVLGAGESVTTIDGGGIGTVVTADNVGATTVLDGFTITNGSAENGGGMYNENSSPTVTNCTFSDNTATYNGGGMYNRHDSSPTVTSCTFVSNNANYGGGMYNDNWAYISLPIVTSCTFTGNSADDYGGGMYNWYSSPTVTDCTFSGNSAGSYSGGGMYNGHSSPMVTDCAFTSNSAGEEGGGMYNWYDSSPTVSNCTFSGNSADGWGGGGMANISNSSPTVTDCTFSGNNANGAGIYDGGGGMYNNDSSPTVTDCTFESNSATNDGGGMYNRYHSSPTVTNCTFTGNSAAYGGGMHNYLFCSPTVTNCTFSGNSATEGDGIYNEDSSPTVTNCILWDGGDEIYDFGTSAPVVTYCDVEGGYSGTGNIDADPLFVDPGTDDYHLQTGSPCIDVGNNSVPSIPSTDFEGDPRIMDGNGDLVAVVDMGVDEHLTIPPGTGLLRVQTDPAVPTTISIDGIPRNAWGLDWVKMPSGIYYLSFTDVFGHLAPTEIEVSYDPPGGDPVTQPISEPIMILPDTTTVVTVNFIPLGNLWVRTDPMVATIISVDGEPPSNNWGFWVDLLPGDYDLSISDVIGYKTPIEVEVTYPGQAPVMQAITDPITVEPGGTTAVVVHFIRLGNLKVETSPNLQATIFVDGEPMNDWGFWVDLEAGDYTVSFEDMDGYLTPPPTVVTVTAGVTTYVTGDYDNGQTIVN